MPVTLRASLLLLAAPLALAAPAALLAQRPDTVDLSVATQLPRTAIPRHYAIELTPDAARLRFDARVRIEVEVVRPTRTLVLNAADLAIRSASIARGRMATMPATVRSDERAQTASFTFARPLTPGRYSLDIVYAGKINTQANGLFALDYKNREGRDARALFTQFEAPDARRMFPGWDEPDYKATYDLTVRVPSSEMAVSNMPAAASRDLGNGLKEVRFQTSPVMSSYLLFFATGDFERVAKRVGDKEVGIVVSRGNGDKAGYALDAEAQILPYYDEYFAYPYPLPKLDNVAGPGQSQFFGAMENWGAIFTFERILLDDPAITSARDRQAIFSVEAHEMAHQWFGNLVTMAWWDDLWLNEGFASWMENRTTEHFHPDWSADVDRVASREAAMRLDSYRSTHPVVQTIRTVEQTNQAFDDITYEKGQSVIAMLEGFAGADVWRDGIRRYMRQHAYRNTRTRDLWAAVEAAGAKGLAEVANDFTLQPGIPLIEVRSARCVDGRTRASLAQGQFSRDARIATAARPLRWRVPVRAQAGGEVTQVVTAGRTAEISVPGCGALLLNPGQSGYYRTLYNSQQSAALVAAFPSLRPVDQYGELRNAFALSEAGYQPIARALDVLAAVPADANGKIAGAAADEWQSVYERFDGQQDVQDAIAARMGRLFGPRLRALGFAPRAGEPMLDSLLRPDLIDSLGEVGNPEVIAEANRLFGAWTTNPAAIPGSLKASWLRVVARNATPATWEQLHAVARRTTGQVERTQLYELLGATRDPALARRALQLALTPEPGATVSAGMISAVAREHPELALDFALANLGRVEQLVDVSARSRFIARLAAGSDDPATIAKLQRYAARHVATTDRRPIEEVIGAIRTRNAEAGRLKGETLAWLRAHPGG